jgi:hypothetical protein
VATPNTVKNILRQAYANSAAVTDELVDCILKPGLEVSQLSGVGPGGRQGWVGGGEGEGGDVHRFKVETASRRCVTTLRMY